MNNPHWRGRVAWLACLAGCGGLPSGDPAQQQPPESGTVTSPLAEVCERLIQSPPHLWPKVMPAVLAHGTAASPDLERILHDTPHAPGAAAVAAVLGRIGRPACAPLLASTMQTAADPVAAEAALALGHLQAKEHGDDLRRTMHDPGRSSVVRSAAATALVQLQTDREALAFLCDLILAGTPAGRARGVQLGLPVDQARWALERNLAINALNGVVGGETPDLDADASWPRLSAGVQQVRQRLGLEPR